MRAVICRHHGLVCEDMNDPVPQAGQVLVGTLACGICGSDLHALDRLPELASLNAQSGSGLSIDADRDMVLGHEFCGELLEHGPRASKRLRPGARVVAMPYVHTADGMEFIGFSNRLPGGFGERLVLQESLLLEVPNGLPTELAALVEPFAVGTHAVAQAAPPPGCVALVVGCGPIGLAVIAALRIAKVAPIIACDLSAARRRLAERMGADIVVDPAMVSPHAYWEALDVPATLASLGAAQLSGRSLREAAVFECVGTPGMLQALIANVPPTSRVTVVGVCMTEDRIQPALAIQKQLRFEFVFAYTPSEFAATLHRLAEGSIDAAPLVSSTVGLSGVEGAFAALRSANGPVKILVDPRRP